MAADPRDLTTLANVHSFLNLDANGAFTADDALLQRYLTAASIAFVNEIYREVLQQTFTEQFDGDDERVRVRPMLSPWLPYYDVGENGFAINLRNYPVNYILSLLVDGTPIPPAIVTGLTATAKTTGGTLASGFRFYRVTAVDAFGETAGGLEAACVVTGPNASVDLTWDPVPGATKYKVWSSSAPGTQATFFDAGVATAYTDTGAGGAAGTLPSTRDGFVLNEDEGRIELSGYRFTRGIKNCAAVYVGGIAPAPGVANVPPDISLAVDEIAAIAYRNRDRLGLRSKSVGGDMVSFDKSAWSESVQRVIDRYKKVLV
jgi:hypothetical protein